jgi:cytidine deaminase
VSLRGERAPASVEASLAAREGAARTFVPAAEVSALASALGLATAREVALLALPVAATLARPWISDYRVGAVGVTEGGDLVLGGNLEFPGASIHHTVHAEGFVTLHARARGLRVVELAVRRARPCAHCRQVLAEMAWAADLRIVDPLGSDVALWDVYPVAFQPGDLETSGCIPGAIAWPGLAADEDGPVLPQDVAGALSHAGSLSHAPYSREPAAIVVRVADGRLFEGTVLESVAFNPTIGPTQDALVALAAAGVADADVREAWLGTVRDARVNHANPARDLLAAVAPAAPLHVRYWS